MPVLVYSLLRILLIVASGFGLYVAGLRGVLLIAGAILIGAGLSYVLLDRFRRASAQWLQDRWGHRPSRFAESMNSDARAEDEALDQAERRQSGITEPGQPPVENSRSDDQGNGQTQTDR